MEAYYHYLCHYDLTWTAKFLRYVPKRVISCKEPHFQLNKHTRLRSFENKIIGKTLKTCQSTRSHHPIFFIMNKYTTVVLFYCSRGFIGSTPKECLTIFHIDGFSNGRSFNFFHKRWLMFASEYAQILYLQEGPSSHLWLARTVFHFNSPFLPSLS